ncbi:MAG: response regulator [Cytophagaceae bacterium]|nr:response regulator [Cytophagaceae bacterium]
MKAFDSMMLIDDDRINNFINLKLLRKLKVADHVSAAINGEQALCALKDLADKGDNCPDLILLDIKMPVMDGFQFIREFQKINFPNKNEVKIVVLTTSQNQRDVITINSLGYNYINKPLTPAKISQAILESAEN